MTGLEKKTVYIENIGQVVIPPRNTKEDIINIVDKLKSDPEFIKDFLEILPESQNSKDNILMTGLEKKTVYIENIGHVVIPPRNTKEDIINIVDKLKSDPEFIKDFLEILPESNSKDND